MNKPAASGDIAAETALSLARRAREARRLCRRGGVADTGT